MSGDRVRIDEGVVFGEAEGRPLRGDLFRPPQPASGPVPGVVILHGGAWREGDPTQLRGYGIALARKGYVCLASEYRLAPASRWPAQIHDAKAAVRWMRAGADDLGVDPDRIVASGNSAGGHLALLLGGTPGLDEFEGASGNAGVPSSVAAVMAVYPPTSLPRAPDAIAAELGGTRLPEPDDPDLAARASPVTHVTPAFPPTLLIHGNADEVVPVRASFLMYERLADAGVPVDLHVYGGAAHGFDAQPAFGRLCVTEMLSFLGRRVGRPAPVTAVS